jgi:alpha-L-fucosidase 2
LVTTYGKPPYEKTPNIKLVELDNKKGYVMDFKTEKGKTYTITPL